MSDERAAPLPPPHTHTRKRIFLLLLTTFCLHFLRLQELPEMEDMRESASHYKWRTISEGSRASGRLRSSRCACEWPQREMQTTELSHSH